jgi:hypothetical protein
MPQYHSRGAVGSNAQEQIYKKLRENSGGNRKPIAAQQVMKGKTSPRIVGRWSHQQLKLDKVEPTRQSQIMRQQLKLDTIAMA